MHFSHLKLISRMNNVFAAIGRLEKLIRERNSPRVVFNATTLKEINLTFRR